MPIAAAVLVLAWCVPAADVRAAQGPDALARIGTAAIEQQRFGDALEAFTSAAALQPGDASHCFGAGIAAFMLGQNDVAQIRFECALTLDPKHLQAAVWLGDLHYRAGRLDEAITLYEAAQQRTPNARELRDQLTVWRKELELESRFHQVRTEHFTALFEAAADEALAREVVERLETAYWRVGSTLDVYPSRPIIVVLYTREQFSDLTGLAAWTAAAYDGRIRVPLEGGLDQRDELDRVLSHEYVHAVVSISGGRTVPAWVSEGLATVLERADSTEAEVMLARGGVRPALSTLHQGFVRFSRRDAEIAYASAAHAVRRLIQQRGAAAVVALLGDLKRGATFASAFHQRMGMRYEDFAAIMARD